MTTRPIGGAALVAGVVGHPIRHSLSPLIHNAWIRAADLEAVYFAYEPPRDGFRPLLDGLRGGSIKGLNVTLPYKEEALRLSDGADELARSAGASNLILFHRDGAIEARNTDGLGLLSALDEQAPEWRGGEGPAVVLGAGGAARGAVAALASAGVRELRVVNRAPERARALAQDFGDRVQAYGWPDLDAALDRAALVLNATPAGLGGEGDLDLPWPCLREGAVVMDMVYRPLRTKLLVRAAQRGHAVVDGLAMLIGQARPAFHALFGQAPPSHLDVRELALQALGEAG